MPPDAARSNLKRSFFRLPEASRRRLRILYHVAFVLLLAHFATVYLLPGYFHDRRGQARGWPGGGFGSPERASPVIEGDDGTRLLRGGDDPSMHFDITTFRLNPANLRYGLGREAFPALIEPTFISADEADASLNPEAPVLAVHIEDEVRVYPIELLTHHEVVNDVVAGVPIFAAYCVLADLGAVYDRRFGDQTLTFALSGYTYADAEVWDGRNAFVLWDRETESLWWPPIGKAVSGPLVDRPLRLLDEAHWSQTTWGEVVEQHPHARVLEPGQDFERPDEWPGLDSPPPAPIADAADPPAIAPRWGRNTLR